MIVRDYLWLNADNSPVARANRIMAAACAKHGGTPADIRAYRRRYEVARRVTVLTIAEQIPEWSAMQIGRFVNRDRSTVAQMVARHRPLPDKVAA